MKISKKQMGNVTVLEPKGKITIGAGDVMLRDAIDAATRSGSSMLLLDLKGVSKMDSSGLGELIAAHNTVTEAGGIIKLMNLPPKLYGVLGATQIVSVFDVFDDEREALESFKAAAPTMAR
jgi:anti-sigma B factor antagonist